MYFWNEKVEVFVMHIKFHVKYKIIDTSHAPDAVLIKPQESGKGLPKDKDLA